MSQQSTHEPTKMRSSKPESSSVHRWLHVILIPFLDTPRLRSLLLSHQPSTIDLSCQIVRLEKLINCINPIPPTTSGLGILHLMAAHHQLLRRGRSSPRKLQQDSLKHSKIPSRCTVFYPSKQIRL